MVEEEFVSESAYLEISPHLAWIKRYMTASNRTLTTRANCQDILDVDDSLARCCFHH